MFLRRSRTRGENVVRPRGRVFGFFLPARPQYRDVATAVTVRADGIATVFHHVARGKSAVPRQSLIFNRHAIIT
jgi:hypothetical protein